MKNLVIGSIYFVLMLIAIVFTVITEGILPGLSILLFFFLSYSYLKVYYVNRDI